MYNVYFVVSSSFYVDMTYEPNKMILLSGETKKGKMTARLIKAVTEPMDMFHLFLHL